MLAHAVPLEGELVTKSVLINMMLVTREMKHRIALVCGTSTYQDTTYGVLLQSIASINELSIGTT